MSAGMISELAQAGIQVSRHGDHLHVEANRGMLTPELRARLAEQKRELLGWIDSPAGVRDRLRLLAARASLPAVLHDRLDDADLREAVGLSDAALLEWLRLRDAGRMMDRCMLPPGYTKAVQCAGCGPVLLWPKCPDHVTACPWCFRRTTGKTIPRPDLLAPAGAPK